MVCKSRNSLVLPAPGRTGQFTAMGPGGQYPIARNVYPNGSGAELKGNPLSHGNGPMDQVAENFLAECEVMVVTDLWVFECELLEEVNNRRRRQRALRRTLWYFVTRVFPEMRHEVSLRRMERAVNASSSYRCLWTLDHPQPETYNNHVDCWPVPPPLRRQLAGPRYSQLGSQHGSIPQNDDHPVYLSGGGGAVPGGGKVAAARQSASIGYFGRARSARQINDDNKREAKSAATNPHRGGKKSSKNPNKQMSGPKPTMAAPPVAPTPSVPMLAKASGPTMAAPPAGSAASVPPTGVMTAPPAGVSGGTGSAGDTTAVVAGDGTGSGPGAPVRAKKAKTTLYVVRSPHANALYTSNGRDHWTVQPSTNSAVMVDPASLPPGGLMRVKNSGSGWYEVSDEPSDNVQTYRVEPATHTVVLPAYRREEVKDQGNWISYPEQAFLVYEPLISKQCHYLNHPDVDEELAKAVSSLREKYAIPSQCTDLLVSTGQYHLARIHRDFGKFNDAGTMRRIHGSKGTAMLDRGNVTALAKLGITHDRYERWYDEAEDCALTIDYPLRKDIKILKVDGVVDENGAWLTRGDLRTYPFFTNTERRVFSDERYFQFSAPNLVPFKSYNFSNNNMTSALRRLIGSRGDQVEPVLRSNAISMGGKLATELQAIRPTCVSVARTCSETLDFSFAGDVKEMHARLRNKREIIPIATDVQECQAFVARESLRFIQCCNRTRLQKMIDGLFTGTRWAYLAIVLGFMHVFRALMSRQACAEIPHIKQKLRQRYVKNNLYATTQLMVGKNDVAEVQLKREVGRDGKAPRTTVSYDAGCMYANELPEFVKVCIDGIHTYRCKEYTLLVYVMAKPKSDTLEKVFASLNQYWRESKVIYVACYSDDTVAAGDDEALNVDVKSCDSGQDIPAFLALYACMRRFHRAHSKGLIEQALIPLKIQPGGRNARESSMTIQFDGPVLGSGLVTTTPLNHTISHMIAIGALYYKANVPGISLAEAFRKGAAAVGHLVTVEKVEVLEDFQFLKRSCTIVTEEVPGCCGNLVRRERYVPFINTACLLRNLGKVEDAMSCRHLGMSGSTFRALTDDQRSDKFFGAVIAGWKNEASNEVLHALRNRFQPQGDLEVEPDSLKFVFEETYDYSHLDVSHGVKRRYRLEQQEIDELVAGIGDVQLGQTRSHRALEKIYRRDYGVSEEDWFGNEPDPIMDPRMENWKPWQM